MSITILHELGYNNVQRGINKYDVHEHLDANALRKIAQNAERIARWARAELKKGCGCV